MIDEREVMDAVEGLKSIGDSFIVQCDPDDWYETRKQIVKLVRPWEDTWGTEITCDRHEKGILVYFVAIKNGSPLKARVKMPWFGMGVGETRRIDKCETTLANVRSQVSIFCSKLGQRISVRQHGKHGYELHRTL